jgi:hypothetical protein
MLGWPLRLSWNNFRPVPDPGPWQFRARNGHPIAAQVGLAIRFYPGNSPRRTDGTSFNDVDVRLETVSLQYVPSRIPQGQEERYLRHEQGHYDLMGLFARELEVALRALHGSTADELTRLARELVEEKIAGARSYAVNVPGVDCQYDQDTNHGMNQRQQEVWNARIARNIARASLPNFTFLW